MRDVMGKTEHVKYRLKYILKNLYKFCTKKYTDVLNTVEEKIQEL